MIDNRTDNFSPVYSNRNRASFGVVILIRSAISTCRMIMLLCELNSMGDEVERANIVSTMKDAVDAMETLIKEQTFDEF